jgi:EmrB/QacA subfamily drug resistance transporter
LDKTWIGDPLIQRNDLVSLANRLRRSDFSLEPYVWRIFVVIVLGSIMSALDTTIVNVALHTLSHDLHSSLATTQWVVSAYLLALAAVVPMNGWAVRRFGARRVYLVALVVFTVASALCAFATSSAELIVFRSIQGVGGGLLAPTGLTILVRAVGQGNLPRAMSLFGFPVVLAPVFGPTLGGILIQSAGWRWIFVINVPIGVLTFILARRLLRRDPNSSDRRDRLDVIGLLLAGVGVVGVTYGLSESDAAGSLSAPQVLIPVVVGLVFVAMFVRRSRRVSYPLLDMNLYRNRAFSAASVVTDCLGAALFGALILLPLYYQVARGQDAIHTGLLLIPQGAGSALGMFVSGRCTNRFGAGSTALVGTTTMVLATLPLLFVTDSTAYVAISVIMFVRGIGVGLAIMPSMTAALSVLTHQQIGDASPQLNVVQRIGGSFGTAIVAVTLQSKIVHLGSHPTANGLARAFGHTYWWVVGISVASMFPTAVLWRIERQARIDGLVTAVPPEDRLLEFP